TRFSRDWSADVCSSDLTARTQPSVALSRQRNCRPSPASALFSGLSSRARPPPQLSSDLKARRRPSSHPSWPFLVREALCATSVRSEEHTSELPSRDKLG